MAFLFPMVHEAMVLNIHKHDTSNSGSSLEACLAARERRRLSRGAKI